MAEIKKGDQFVFVGGAPRSGTTLLQNMLDSHPEILGGPEFMHLPDIMRLREQLHNSIRKERIDLYCSYEDVDKQICMLIENFLLPFLQKYNAKILAEKTPTNVLVFSQLMQLFPGACFIQVVRDPRAIVASMLQVGKRTKKMEGLKTQDFTYSLIAAIRYIKRCFKYGFAASESRPDRVLTIVYENLVSDPVNETKKICKFIGVKWHQDILYPSTKIHLGEKAICKNIWYNKKLYYRNPTTVEIDKWKEQLNLFQKAIIFLSFCDDQRLINLGYNFSTANYRKSSRISFLFTRKALKILSNYYNLLLKSLKV